MKRVFKTILVVGLCGVGTLALAHAVLGKHRTRDVLKKLQKVAQAEADELIAKKSDIREDLAQLREEYPKQIALVKSQIREVERQLEKVSDEETRGEDIVRLCEEDISYLEDQRDSVGAIYGDDRAIEHRGGRYSAEEAGRLVLRIEETRGIYLDRLNDLALEREMLEEELSQLNAELEGLEFEQSEFEAEYQSLVRELERLERNEEMLKLVEKRDAHRSTNHSAAMDTLDGVRSAVERARLEQEERLKSARGTSRDTDYESRARVLELERKREARRKTEGAPETPAPAGDDEADETAEEEMETRSIKG